jgi:RHS repeat-associated protein
MVELSGRTETYQYNDANQLVSQTISGAAANQNGSVGYVLDAVGNRLQRNSTIAAIPSTVNSFNNRDQLNTDGYDANGNTIAADGKTFSYTYDNRLKSVNGNAVTLGYDGNNNRTSKTVGGVTTNYLVDELSPSGYAQVVEEQVAGSVRKAYVWGHMLISQRQLVGANWVTSYYGQDGSENVRQLFDNSGAVTDTFDYDAFGILIGRTGTTANNYLYRGQQFDGELGAYYQRARYYSEARGRFLTMDEFDGIADNPKSIHKFIYANNDPINLVDPNGFNAGELGIGYGTIPTWLLRLAIISTSAVIACTITKLAYVAAGATEESPNPCAKDFKKCEQEFPGVVRCSQLYNYPYNSSSEALMRLKLQTGIKNLRKENDGLAKSGPCAEKEGSAHYSVKDGKTYIASIVQCKCCEDFNGTVKAHTKTKCGII